MCLTQDTTNLTAWTRETYGSVSWASKSSGMDLEVIKAKIVRDLARLQDTLSTDKKGIMVQVSVLGAFQARLRFLQEDT